VAGASFDLVDAVDGAQIDGVDGEAVEGVGGQSDDVAAVEAGDDVPDERRFGLFGMNAECFSRQNSGSYRGAGEYAPWGYLLRKVFKRRGLGSDFEVVPGQFPRKVFETKKLTLPVEAADFAARR
jgi:hypothetical protein